METHEQAMHPPTEPVPIQRAALGSTWPGVLGSVGIAFGVLGMLNGVMGVVGAFMMDWIASMGAASGAPGGAGMSEMAKYQVAMIVSGVLTLLVALVLLTGGIGLVKRAGWGPKVVLVWAGLKVLLGTATSVLSVVMQRDQMAAMQAEMAQQGTGAPAAMMGSMTETMMIVGLVLGVAWAWALPLFYMVWFMRPKIRAEVRTWREPRGFAG